jgi:hypothetical protein
MNRKEIDSLEAKYNRLISECQSKYKSQLEALENKPSSANFRTQAELSLMIKKRNTPL